MSTASIVASGIGPALQGGITVGNELEQAEQQQETTKQAKQTTQERQLVLDHEQQIIPGDTYLKLTQQRTKQMEADLAQKIQGIKSTQDDAAAQQSFIQARQATTGNVLGNWFVNPDADQSDLLNSKLVNRTDTKYSKVQVIGADGSVLTPQQARKAQAGDKNAPASLRLLPADANGKPVDVPYDQTLRAMNMNNTSIEEGKDNIWYLKHFDAAKGEFHLTPLTSEGTLGRTGDFAITKGAGVGTINPQGNGPSGSGGALERESKTQGIIKDGNQTIFKTLGADAFGALNPEQQPLAMQATYLFEQSVRQGRLITPATALAQAKVVLARTNGKPQVTGGFVPSEGGGTNAQPSDATSQARAAFNKILGTQGFPDAASKVNNAVNRAMGRAAPTIPSPSANTEQSVAAPAGQPAAPMPAAPQMAPVATAAAGLNTAQSSAPVNRPQAAGIAPRSASLQDQFLPDTTPSGGEGIPGVLRSIHHAIMPPAAFIQTDNGRTRLNPGQIVSINRQRYRVVAPREDKAWQLIDLVSGKSRDIRVTGNQP